MESPKKEKRTRVVHPKSDVMRSIIYQHEQKRPHYFEGRKWRVVGAKRSYANPGHIDVYLEPWE